MAQLRVNGEGRGPETKLGKEEEPDRRKERSGRKQEGQEVKILQGRARPLLHRPPWSSLL